jgi:hypothetical protein
MNVCLLTLLIALVLGPVAHATGLDQVEQQLLQQTFPQDPPQARIERLETLVFGAPRTGDMTFRETQLLQLFTQGQQLSSTLEPLPGLAPSVAPVAQPTPAQAPVQGVAAPSLPLSSNLPSTTLRYSDEFMAMLPPTVQAQLRGEATTHSPGMVRVGGTMASQETWQSTLPVQTLQQQSMGPVAMMSQQTFPSAMTAPKPWGMTQAQGFTPLITQTSHWNGIPVVQHTRVPAPFGGHGVHPSLLSALEWQHLGQMNPYMPTPYRVSQLEQAVLGHAMPHLPMQTRLMQLQHSGQAPGWLNISNQLFIR